MASLKLDKSRQYGDSFPGEICPTTGKRGVFTQDGYYFDNNGNVLPDLLGKDDKERLAIREKQMDAERKATDVLRKALVDAGLDPDDVEIKTVPKDLTAQVADEDETVDLRAWFRRERVYPWFKVRKQLKDDYKFLASNAEAGREFLEERFGEQQ